MHNQNTQFLRKSIASDYNKHLTFPKRNAIIKSRKAVRIMKKTMYYLSPFVIVPLIFLTLTVLDGAKLSVLKSSAPYLMFAALLLFSVAIGIFSPAKTKFDYMMTAAVPISLLLSVFVALLFDAGCDGSPQLSLGHALNMEYYKVWLPIVIAATLVTFIASFRPIRSFFSKKKLERVENA